MSAKLSKAEIIASIEQLPDEVVLEDVIECLIELKRQNGSQETPAKQTYNFTAGEKYKRKDIFRIIGKPEDTWGGPWFTGYARHGSDWFLFCNVGAAGRTGHDYENEWVGEQLHWYGKKQSKLSHPSIQSMIGDKGEVYMRIRG